MDTGGAAERLIMRAAAPRDPTNLVTPEVRADRSKATRQMPLDNEACCNCWHQAIKTLASVKGKRVALLSEVFNGAGGGANDGKAFPCTNVVRDVLGESRQSATRKKPRDASER